MNTLIRLKGKVLPQVTYAHKQFLKQSFKRIDFHQVKVFKDALEINGETIKLLPINNFPEYTNEVLASMAITELWDLAQDYGFDPNRYGCRDYNSLLKKYGESRLRPRLKAFVYTHPDNHPVRCYALSHQTKQLVDLAKELWTFNKIASFSNAKFNILQYTKPGIHLLKALEIS